MYVFGKDSGNKNHRVECCERDVDMGIFEVGVGEGEKKMEIIEVNYFSFIFFKKKEVIRYRCVTAGDHFLVH